MQIAILGVIVIGVLIILIYNIYLTNKENQSDFALESEEGILKALNFLTKINEMKAEYFRFSDYKKLHEEYHIVFNQLNTKMYKALKNNTIYEFINVYSNFESLRTGWNNEYIENELRINSQLFDNIDGKALDEQQRLAVVVDEDNNLVLAGAGSGKTLTISAKVKYLVERKGIKPEEILLITFTKKAADEMQDRISNNLNIKIKALTFHKLGYDIISSVNGRRFNVFDDLLSVINEYFNSNILIDKHAIQHFITFYGNYLTVPKDLQEFECLGDAHDYYKDSDFETLKSKFYNGLEQNKLNKITVKGEQVKSLEEVMVANYLFLNGINYTYEKEYCYDTGDKYRKQYKPDFYLDDYDIYLEHFGITSDNKVPWLKPIEAMKYLDSIKWKRELHKEKNTTLIETYSYYVTNGSLYSELDNLLKAHGVVFNKVDYAKIYKTVFENNNNKYFLELKKLIQTFIGLFKSNGFDYDDFYKLMNVDSNNKNEFIRNRSILFLSIVKPIYAKYQNHLNNIKEIDFNDMINFATNCVNQGKVELNYKYIIIDEYQDISVSRFKLIQAIKSIENSRVMAVGDDWQSIYRFAGSDINLFTDFSKYLGYSKILKIERTYRNSQELINIAGSFIMKNPKQLKKNLVSDKHHSSPIRIVGYNSDIQLAIKKAVDEIINLHGENTNIMILGRNNFDIDVLGNSTDFKIIKKSTDVSIKYIQCPKTKISFLTAHRSKGLEAENVIIINLTNKIVGFPNKIADDPVLALVLSDQEEFDFAEERRLFYVAITRTKNCSYLIVPDKFHSIFYEELENTYKLKFDMATGEESIKNNPNCPLCQKGYLVLRKNINSASLFLGCTNFPQCNFTNRNIEILNKQIICVRCGGYMVERTGKYGAFYGCTNYPYCQQTVQIEQE